MAKRGCTPVVALLLAVPLAAGYFSWGWWFSSSLAEEREFVIPSGSSLSSVAEDLEEQGIISSADGFLTRAKIFGSSDPIQAGEFLILANASASEILETFQNGDVIRRFVTIPEGMPSVLVHERLMANDMLTGQISVPAEGSILPESYNFERGSSRGEILAQMQQGMKDTIAELWPKRSPNTVVKTPEEAIVLASIVEKETGTAEERRMVAGLYSNRLRIGMRLQADPTIIYPMTKGKPLGRRIRKSEIAAVNDYNTYSMAGLPKGPITNPGRASIEAVLNPADTKALYMVADGSGGHAFANTLAEHNANVAKWYALRRDRGEM